MFAYNYAQDTNLLNLRFCIYLLSEELETIINNLDESHGNNYINSIDAKLEKRNEIINYLLKEKAVTQKLFTRMLSVFVNSFAECGDLLALAEVLTDSKEKGRFVAKVKAMQADLAVADEFKAYAKAYFTEKDLQNLVGLQREVANPLTRDQYLKITDFVPVFDRVDRYSQLLEEYRMLANDMSLKEENYSRLLKKYDQLLKDFTELTVQGTRQIVNPLGPDDYNAIFAKYKEVKEQDRQDRELIDKEKAAGQPKKSNSKKKTTNKDNQGRERDPTPQKNSGKKNKSKSITKKNKGIYDEETDAMSFNEVSQPVKPKKKVTVESPERYTGYHPQTNPFQGSGEANLSMESLQPTLNNSFKQHQNPDIDLSKISKHDDSPQLNRANTYGLRQQPKVTFESDKKAVSSSNHPKLESKPTLDDNLKHTDHKKENPGIKETPSSTIKPSMQPAAQEQIPKFALNTENGASKADPPRPTEVPKQQTPRESGAVQLPPPGQPASQPPTPPQEKPAARPQPPPTMALAPAPPLPPARDPPSPSALTPPPGAIGFVPPPPGLLAMLNQQ
jgi:hypothetical protein